jgi:hypothetical protein
MCCKHADFYDAGRIFAMRRGKTPHAVLLERGHAFRKDALKHISKVR